MSAPHTAIVVAKIPPCDICHAAPAAVDGRTVYGPWGYLCELCWALHGCGELGLGHGQRLVLDA